MQFPLLRHEFTYTVSCHRPGRSLQYCQWHLETVSTRRPQIDQPYHPGWPCRLFRHCHAQHELPLGLATSTSAQSWFRSLPKHTLSCQLTGGTVWELPVAGHHQIHQWSSWDHSPWANPFQTETEQYRALRPCKKGPERTRTYHHHSTSKFHQVPSSPSPSKKSTFPQPQSTSSPPHLHQHRLGHSFPQIRLRKFQIHRITAHFAHSQLVILLHLQSGGTHFRYTSRCTKVRTKASQSVMNYWYSWPFLPHCCWMLFDVVGTHIKIVSCCCGLGQNPDTLVIPQIARKWMFIPKKRQGLVNVPIKHHPRDINSSRYLVWWWKQNPQFLGHQSHHQQKPLGNRGCFLGISWDLSSKSHLHLLSGPLASH